jgi:hypothetical protein
MGGGSDCHKDVLKQFLAPVVVAVHSADERQKWIGVAAQQDGQRLPLAGCDPLHQAFIGFLGQFQVPAPVVSALLFARNRESVEGILEDFVETGGKLWVAGLASRFCCAFPSPAAPRRQGTRGRAELDTRRVEHVPDLLQLEALDAATEGPQIDLEGRCEQGHYRPLGGRWRLFPGALDRFSFTVLDTLGTGCRLHAARYEARAAGRFQGKVQPARSL